MNIFKGIAEDVTADAWFNEMIWPYESKMTDEDVYTGTLLGIAEMINNGVTVFADHYFGEEQVLRAVKETGIRRIWRQRFSVRPPILERDFLRSASLLKSTVESPGVLLFIWGLTQTIPVPGKHWGRLWTKRNDWGFPFTFTCLRRMCRWSVPERKPGLTPFGILHRAGGFDCKVLVGHGLWIEEEDLKLLRQDTWFAFCPKTYMKLASGRGGFFDYYKKLNYGFGTDGAASSNTLNPMEQARLFGLLGKYQDRDSSHFTASEIWQHLMAGHQAFPFGTGRLAKGAPADLAVWDLSSMDTFPYYNPISAILYSSNSQNVKIYHGGRRIPEI